MAMVNMILQGKGGVGKSFIATLLAEHYKAHNIETVCVDTDPVNATFAGYAAYGVRRLKIVDGDDIDPEKFDELVEIVAAAPEGSAVIVDNGAATFVSLCASLMEDPDLRRRDFHGSGGGRQRHRRRPGFRARLRGFVLAGREIAGFQGRMDLAVARKRAREDSGRDGRGPWHDRQFLGLEARRRGTPVRLGLLAAGGGTYVRPLRRGPGLENPSWDISRRPRRGHPREHRGMAGLTGRVQPRAPGNGPRRLRQRKGP